MNFRKYLSSQKRARIYYLSSFLVIGIFILMMFSSMNFDSGGWSNGFYTLTSSDPSLLLQISKDFLKNAGSIADWNFGTCYYLFPNLLIMLILSILILNPSIVIFANSVILFVSLIILVNVLFKKIFAGISNFSLVISNLSILLFVVFTLVTGDFGTITSHLFLPLHSGAFINTLLALILIFIYLKQPSLKFILLIILLNILAIVSDKLFIVYWVAPCFFSLVTFYLVSKGLKTRRIVILVTSIVLSGVLGYLLQDNMSKWGILHIYPVNSMPDNRHNSFNLMFNSIYEISTSHPITIVITGLSIISFLLVVFVAVGRILKSRHDFNADSNFWMIYFLFTFYFVVITFSAPLLTGTFQGIDCIRYIIPSLYLCILNSGLLLEYFFRNSVKRHLYLELISFSLLMILIVFGGLNYSKYDPSKAISKIENYYPPIVKATDELSLKYKIKNGIGGYWDARFITVFSRENVTIDLVGSNFQPATWANNPYYFFYNDYKDKRPMIFNFIVLRTLEDSSIIFKVFDRKIIKKEIIDGFEFYILPDFIVKKDLSSFELYFENISFEN